MVLLIMQILGDGETVTVAVDCELAPRLSATVAVTVYVPAFEYKWFTLLPATGALPSPKLTVEDASVPSASVDNAVEAVTFSGAVPLAGFTDTTAFGGRLAGANVTALEKWFLSDGLPMA